jgi:hypothetical protein
MSKQPQSHNTAATHAGMAKHFDLQFANVADYDCIIQVTFPDTKCFENVLLIMSTLLILKSRSK